jgi:hypothetical protein
MMISMNMATFRKTFFALGALESGIRNFSFLAIQEVKPTCHGINAAQNSKIKKNTKTQRNGQQILLEEGSK